MYLSVRPRFECVKEMSQPGKSWESGRTETELLRQFVSSVIGGAVFTLDPGGIVVGWSQRAERIAGWKPDRIVGRHMSVMFPPDEVRDRTPWRELERAEARGRSQHDGWRLRDDGSRFLASTLIFAVRPNIDLGGFVVLLREPAASVLDDPRIRLAWHERIAHDLRFGAIRTFFGVGMSLQSLAVQAKEAELRARLEAAVADLDRGIQELRAAMFGSRG